MTTVTTVTTPEPTAGGAAKPMLAGCRPRGESVLVHGFVLLPMLALAAAVPLAWGQWPCVKVAERPSTCGNAGCH